MNTQQADLERRYTKPVLYLLTGGLAFMVDRQGGVFMSFTARSQGGDVLLIVRAVFDERSMVAFVGAATMAGALARLYDDLRGNQVKWRKDKYQVA